MTKFERIGVNIQLGCCNTTEANKAFSQSCYICCSKGRNGDCDKCAIASTNANLVAYFADRERRVKA